MPSYTTLTNGARTRVLRVRPNTDAVSVTAISDPQVARTVADVLTTIGSDLPWIVEQVLTGTGVDLPGEPDEFTLTDPLEAWTNADVTTDPIDVTRRALAAFDQPPAGLPDGMHMIPALAQALDGQPDAVRRAVRTELADLLRDWDDIPVMAWARDHKWQDCSWTLLINAGLARMSDEQLLSQFRYGDIGAVIDVLEARGDVEIPASVTDVADSGYLRVLAHPAQMRAWLAAHRPHLLDAFNTGLRHEGIDA